MPPSLSTAQAVPGNFSGSRKRSHAEITRSETRSQSPHPPPKRRRTESRRPTMSAASSSQQNPVQDTIDLTLDDDSPSPPQRPAPLLLQDSSNEDGDLPPVLHDPLMPRAPPFTNHAEQQVIDLSSDVEEDEFPVEIEEEMPAPSSPEVQFIRERTLPQPQRMNNHTARRPIFPTPPSLPVQFGDIAEFLRDGLQNVWGNLRRAHEPADVLERIDGIFSTRDDAPMMPVQANLGADDFDDVQLDYARPAFPLRGGELLIIEDPNPHPTPHALNQSPYKEPAPAKEGFTRNYEEDDMLICALCSDELATGKTDQKQQVWIVKQCGHAYCGDCAHNRVMSKRANNRDSKRVANKKTNSFKVCAVPGCEKAVDSKTKMFQIYL